MWGVALTRAWHTLTILSDRRKEASSDDFLDNHHIQQVDLYLLSHT